MSGHSHFSTIKRKKEVTDKKRSQIFSKMTQVIALAAKDGGSSPETNSKLKNAIEDAKKLNLPKALIEKAIQKGSGKLDSGKIESFLFEAHALNNVVLLIEGITDNKNRSLGEIKKTLTNNNAKLVTEGAVRWQFEQKGIIIIENQQDKEETELEIIDSGAENFEWQEDILTVYTKVEDLEKVKEKINTNIDTAFLGWVAKERININGQEKIENLIEELLENDSVQKVYSNLK